MATRHSTRTRAGGRNGARSHNSATPSTNPAEGKSAASRKRSAEPADRKKTRKERSRPSLYEILGHFGEAFAFVETAYSVLETLQDDCDCAALTPAVHTLRHGMRALERVWSELDVATLPKS